MAYTTINFKTKKSLKEAVARGDKVTIYSPGPFPCNQNGVEYIEGPHGRHTWYAKVTMENGYVVKVK